MTVGRHQARLRQAQVLCSVLLALAVSLPTLRPALAGDFLTGRLLVAGPNLPDPNFSRTVVFMLRHDASGAEGLVVNRPEGKVPLHRLLQMLENPGGGDSADPARPEQDDPAGGDTDLPVFYGGPVAPFLGFTLHSRDVMLENSVAVGDAVALDLQADVLQALAKGNGPQRLLFLLGYAGWGPGQLESELDRNDWCVIEADPALIFSAEPAQTWERAAARCSTAL